MINITRVIENPGGKKDNDKWKKGPFTGLCRGGGAVGHSPHRIYILPFMSSMKEEPRKFCW